MRATLETDNHYKFVFFKQNVVEMVRCFYPDGERETVTLDYFIRVLRKEANKRKSYRAKLRAYRERNR